MTKVRLTINGQAVTAESDQTILEAAREAGIDIPTLCHHPALSNWGSCRMCLVQVERMRGFQTACTCPVSEGMAVQTETPQIVEMRRFLLQLLFSERNHYCMFCQMSGDCRLQDMAYRYGLDHWTYPRAFPKLEVDASRKYFIMDPNRCILCSACVRACAEVAANHTLTRRNRGSKTMIVADLDVPFGESSCVECGTCLQVCPTGALIDARSAYGGREKDVVHTKTTCTQCSVGCALDVVARANRLLRIDGVWESEPSCGLLCVNGRFKPLYDTRARVEHPMVRRNGALVEATWDEALDAVSSRLQTGAALGLTTCATSNEALASFSALFKKAKGEAGRIAPMALHLGFGEQGHLSDLLDADLIIIAGADPLNYQPVLGYFVKRAQDSGTRLATIGGGEAELGKRANMAVDYADASRVVALAASAGKTVVVYSVALTSEVKAAFKPIAEKALFIGLDPSHNGRGAELAGLLPIETGKADLLYLLLGEEPEQDGLAAKLDGAFTVAHASYFSDLVDRADVVLPAPIWAERSGHVTNLEWRVLPLNPAVRMPGGVRDEAEVLQSLAARL